MKRLLLVIAGFSVGAAITAGIGMTGTTTGAAKGHMGATVTIRHQLRGCHSWSVNGGAYRAKQVVRLGAGGSIKFVNTDVMPHTLVQTAGPKVRYSGSPAMRHMSASVRATFPRAGVYRFKTKAGEDYSSGIKTVGPDNVLRLVVKVS